MSASDPNKFVILFNGELHAGISRDSSLERLSVLTNIDRTELLEALFSIRPVIVNEVDSEALAETYRAALDETGLEVWVEPVTEDHDEITNVELEFGHYAPMERTDSKPNYLIDTDELAGNPVSDDPPQDPPSIDEPGYAVVFYGYLDPGYKKTEVIENIRHLTKASEQRIIEELFSVVPVVIKRSTDRKLAEEYLDAFQRAGMELDLDADFTDPDASESTLALRYDAPPVLPTRRVQRFTYYLLGIAALAVIAWTVIFISMEGFFRQSQEMTIELKLQAPQPPAPQPVIQPAVEKPAPIQPEEPAPEPDSVPVEKTTAPPEEAVIAQPRIRSSAETEATEKNYYMTLLSWFAHPQHQQYGSETRKLNLEGEIELQITIKRDGTLKDVRVSRSSSAELADVTTATARRASPYPAVPATISGAEYSFKLPLKYTLEDSQ